MKKAVYKPVIVLLFALFIGNSCSKDNIAPIDKLPQATQTGENTAGCLVNGKAFLPKGSALSGPVLSAFYQFVDGSYHLGFGFKNNEQDHLRDIYIYVNEQLSENSVYILKTSESTNSYGEYAIGGGLVDLFETSDEITGELTITKLDPAHSIISGTFWFDAVNEAGEVVEIREGRFDMQYVN